MKSTWNHLLSCFLLVGAVSFCIGSGVVIQPLQAQDADVALEGEVEEVEAVEAVEAVESEVADVAEEETVEEEELPAQTVGYDKNAKGLPASEYMHSVTTERAISKNLAELVDAEQQNYIDATMKLPAQYRDDSAVILVTDGAVKLANPVLPADYLQNNSGKTIRFHIWIQAENVAAEDGLWTKSPALLFQLFDDNGNLVATAESIFKTRGSYPWHNYYVDMVLPRQFQLTGKAKKVVHNDALLEMVGAVETVTTDQPGLYLTLSNLGGGKAWFAGLSYEIVTPANRKDLFERIDDGTATMAPNPQYDELPMQLFYGLNTKLPWRFLNGNQAYESLRTIDGLKNYIAVAKNDWFQMQKGVAMLPYLYVTASTLNLTEPFEDNWLETLRSELESLQDSATGYWLIDETPNLLVTSALVVNCFSPKSLTRADVKSTETPWNATGKDATVSYAQAIVNTTLSHCVKGTPVWNNYAFHSFAEKDKKRTDLLATCAAVQLLSYAKEALPEDSAELMIAEEAIEKAYKYVISTYVIPQTMLWTDSNDNSFPAASPEGLLEIIEASKVLERRTNDELTNPEVTARRIHSSSGLDKMEVRWKGSEKELVSVRVYAAPSTLQPSLLGEEHLIGIIERKNALPKNQDPLRMVERLSKAAQKYWGVTLEDMNAEYIAGKLASIGKYLGNSKRFTVGSAGEKVVMNVSSPKGFGYNEDDAESVEIKVYAVGVNAYGETTTCIPLDADEKE